ncbi:hypothetical protein HYH03_017276 [Edaphochlamys debaryana]|uniref:Sugar phosphate transporter domain-containing protein n=1 Tax=Edaphochlamys debaryana TaxID=47281 RepID=A0A836BPF6_9CHLO|nr:hypothetical protein HYH03_017276 [Edaphochlamys debaryana]|eukprot:KAG2483882.1 hypothetical protein HYH03_017276 [Edaphochlamys debaryana]
MDSRKGEGEPLLPLSATSVDGHMAMEKGSRGGLYQWALGFIGIGSAILYGTVAVSMNFVNKASMQMLPLPNCVMVLQMAATAALLHPLLTAGYLDFPRFSWHKCRRLFWITALYTANVGFALFGLKTLNIPMYNVLKRLTPMIILVVKAVIRRRLPPLQISLSVLLVVAGCVVAGIGDLSFDLWGYLFALMSCLVQAGYLLLVEFQGDEGVGTTELLYYNALTSLPFLLAVVGATGEAGALRGAYAAALAAHGFGALWGTLLSAALMGCLLNYALFLCTVNNSALTTTIVGVIKGVVAVFLGFFLLGGVRFNAVNVAGIALNTLGAIWYTALKYLEKQEKRGAGDKGGPWAHRNQLANAPSSDPLGVTLGAASSANLLGGQGMQLSDVASGPSESAKLSPLPRPPLEAGAGHVVTEGDWSTATGPSRHRKNVGAV